MFSRIEYKFMNMLLGFVYILVDRIKNKFMAKL